MLYSWIICTIDILSSSFYHSVPWWDYLLLYSYCLSVNVIQCLYFGDHKEYSSFVFICLYIEVYLIYNVVLVQVYSKVIQLYALMYFVQILFPFGYYKILSIVSCSIKLYLFNVLLLLKKNEIESLTEHGWT